MAKKDKNAWKWRTFGGPLFSILVWKPPVSDVPDERTYVHLVTWTSDTGPCIEAYTDAVEAVKRRQELDDDFGAMYACLDTVEVK